MERQQTLSYARNISRTIRSLLAGLRITLRHLVKSRRTQAVRSISEPNYFKDRDGIATIQYPYEMQPVPDNGRYRLHNEIDACIVCDKCAKICPVDASTLSRFGRLRKLARPLTELQNVSMLQSSISTWASAAFVDFA